MFNASNYTRGFKIDRIATCDFSRLNEVTNEDILKRGREGRSDERLLRFVTERMGIKRRFFAPASIDALDLARDSLKALIAKDPSVVEQAEFLVYAGISSPMPTVCHAALLAGEFGFKKVSCWDLKSGCSTGVLALAQALEWFQHGARKGVIVCSETFSKFTDPSTLQMSASTGDGACALSASATDDWKVRGVVHGTDAEYLKSMYVPGKYPIALEKYSAKDYVFAFEEKGDTLKKMAEYWQTSLQDLLSVSGIEGAAVTHYVSHQVDGTKNAEIANKSDIPIGAVFRNFEAYGNMGCPTIFLNYLLGQATNASSTSFKKGDLLVLHAVGGGLSWAGICAEKVQ